MFVARDKNKFLCLYYDLPHRSEGGDYWSRRFRSGNLDEDLLPDLTWESEPLEVELQLVGKVAELEKMVELMGGFLADRLTCPVEDIDFNLESQLDCEHRCSEDFPICKECWIKYFQQQAQSQLATEAQND